MEATSVVREVAITFGIDVHKDLGLAPHGTIAEALAFPPVGIHSVVSSIHRFLVCLAKDYDDSLGPILEPSEPYYYQNYPFASQLIQVAQYFSFLTLYLHQPDAIRTRPNPHQDF